MLVSKNKVVSFHYSLFNQAGEEIENTKDAEPEAILIGAENTFDGLERAMIDKSVGDKLTVTLAPHEAYGIRKDDQQRISAKYLKHAGKLRPGQVVQLDSNYGMQTVTVIKVGKFSVDVDLNHPLAGQQITFEVEITDIRDAQLEEISHGHAHGAGGHHH